jgi:hypothetical protein
MHEANLRVGLLLRLSVESAHLLVMHNRFGAV